MVITMLIRLGYACISKTVENITPSTNFTYTEYLKNHDLKKLQNIHPLTLSQSIKRSREGIYPFRLCGL